MKYGYVEVNDSSYKIVYRDLSKLVAAVLEHIATGKDNWFVTTDIYGSMLGFRISLVAVISEATPDTRENYRHLRAQFKAEGDWEDD